MFLSKDTLCCVQVKTPPFVFFTIRCAPIRGALMWIRVHVGKVIVEHISQIIICLFDQGVVEGDVGTVVLPQEKLQQGHSLILPGGLETATEIYERCALFNELVKKCFNDLMITAGF